MLRIHSTTYARLPRNARRIPRLLSRYTHGAASPAPYILGYTPHGGVSRGGRQAPGPPGGRKIRLRRRVFNNSPIRDTRPAPGPPGFWDSGQDIAPGYRIYHRGYGIYTPWIRYIPPMGISTPL